MPTFLENCKALGLNPLRAINNCHPEKCKAGCSDCDEVYKRSEEDWVDLLKKSLFLI